MERLKMLRVERGLLQKDVASIIGVDRTTYVKYEKGNSEPPIDTLSALADFYGTTVDYLLGRTDDRTDYEDPQLIANLNDGLLDYFNGDVKKALAVQEAIDKDAMSESRATTPPDVRKGIKIPVLGRVAAGLPLEAVEEIIGYEEITPELAASGDYFALAIQGDSMAPTICQGDVVVVRKQEDIENGEIAVVLVNGQDATVKKFFRTEQGVKLVPLNPNYEPLFFTAEEVGRLPVVAVGKVVELRRKF